VAAGITTGLGTKLTDGALKQLLASGAYCGCGWRGADVVFYGNVYSRGWAPVW